MALIHNIHNYTYTLYTPFSGDTYKINLFLAALSLFFFFKYRLIDKQSLSPNGRDHFFLGIVVFMHLIS
ncbi:uncharacterized protein EV154DRAFT_440995 [Mucor mucedo]|uniref:uncharacterized protein n=1 Tax=Mucor mucedo TaxID=29922 RepID=UPI00221E4622|nr:uncharacterized protein EV154DRAFT_440995 [Mucor mucedo]KAI7892768.1 hypothetical protein EV154DRAFT_440995 [Mucor mucedo]